MDKNVSFMRLVTVIEGMKMHLRTGGKLRLTRTATPARLRAIATEYTGKSYARSQKGMETALSDLYVIKEKMMEEARLERAKAELIASAE